MRKKPVCFIAMAFNRTDTERLFEISIQPVLLKNAIDPIIINRQEDNQDLNVQIFNQLDSCDFAIVDLTYARPSVYFEAGYAQRKVEVIYTVRRDHLNRNNPEDRRVHFDLSMKNIIAWDSPDDKNFSTRLEKRVKSTFLNKWLVNNNLYLEQEEQRKKFESMSIDESLKILRYSTIKELKRMGYAEWIINHPYYPNINYPKKELIAGKFNYLFSRKVDGEKYYIVAVNAFASILKREFLDLRNFYDSIILTRRTDNNKAKNRISFHLFFLSIRDIPVSRIQDVYPSFEKIDGSKFYKAIVVEKNIRVNNNQTKKIDIDYYLHVVSKIKSIPEFIGTLTKIFSSSDI